MNPYTYCRNNPVGRVDPSGEDSYCFLDPGPGDSTLTFARLNDNREVVWSMDFEGINEWMRWAVHNTRFDEWGAKNLPSVENRIGWKLAEGNRYLFWYLQALMYLTVGDAYTVSYESIITKLNGKGIRFELFGAQSQYRSGLLAWDPADSTLYEDNSAYDMKTYGPRKWHWNPPLVSLAHELYHAYQDKILHTPGSGKIQGEREVCWAENYVRYALYRKDPDYADLLPRPIYVSNWYQDDVSWADWSLDTIPPY